MTTTFKTGDRIRRVGNPHPEMPLGFEAVVREARYGGREVNITNAHGHRLTYSSCFFSRATPVSPIATETLTTYCGVRLDTMTPARLIEVILELGQVAYPTR